jgi:hypothetical protein
MWTDYFRFLGTWVIVAMMLRASFELQRPSSTPQIPSFLAKNEEEWAERRKEWSRKAVEGYVRSQEKKWRKWDETMFKAKLI